MIEYYQELKVNEPQLHVTTGMNFVNILLSEICQTQKDKYCIIPLIRSI